MGLKQWWQTRQKARARRYLHTHQSLARDILRDDHELASHLVLAAAANAPDRQTLMYPILGQFGRSGGASSTLPKNTPYNLRRFSETPPARRAINAITDPIVALPWQIELIPPADTDRLETVPPPTPEQHQRILAANAVFAQPNDSLGWRTFLEECLEDMLVYGAMSIEVAPTRDPARPLYLWPVDTQSIRINAHWDGDPGSYRYAQAPGVVGLSVLSHNTIPLRDQDLLYIRLNPRTNTPFGLGYLEVAFEAVNAFLGAFSFAEKRASNDTPDYLIFLGEHVTVDKARQWQDYWENEIEGRGKVPIIGGGTSPSVVPLVGSGSDPLWLQWQDFLIKLIAISFGLSPMKLGIERDVNRSTAEVSQTSDWSSIEPVADTVAHALTSELLHKHLGWADLRFAWKIQESDTLRQASVLEKQYAMNAITVDELREIYERPPLPDGLGARTKTAYEEYIKTAMAPAPEDEDEAVDEDEDMDEDDDAAMNDMDDMEEMDEMDDDEDVA